MPLKIREPVAKVKGRKPFIFFKGSETELSKIPSEGIVTALAEAGVRYFQQQYYEKKPGEKLSVANAMKEEVTASISKLRESSEKEGIFQLQGPFGAIRIKLALLPNGRVCLHQYPVTHGVTYRSRDGKRITDSFECLEGILGGGYVGHSPPNVTLQTRRRPPGYSQFSIPSTGKGYGRKTEGDKYSIQIMAQDTPDYPTHGYYGTVWKASPDQILRVNIHLNPKLSKEQVRERKAWYRDRLKRYGIPFGFLKTEKET
jgi:hypothetical protein